jgi:hypothetical protein
MQMSRVIGLATTDFRPRDENPPEKQNQNIIKDQIGVPHDWSSGLSYIVFMSEREWGPCNKQYISRQDALPRQKILLRDYRNPHNNHDT